MPSFARRGFAASHRERQAQRPVLPGIGRGTVISLR
jgi:hypothetical protein